MISMDFLSKRVAGTEFIDFQNADFYNALSGALKEHIRYDSGSAVLESSCEEIVKKLIAQYTGFRNITFNFSEEGSLYVDTGYFSPGHVLNSKGVDVFFKATQSTLYRWFTENKNKIFKGGIDYSTGRVSGSFCDIPVELGINMNITDYFSEKQMEKWGVPFEGMLAGAICHELGHVFSGCMMLLTVLEDNLVAQSALQFYRNATRPEDRVVVLKDAAALLGMKSGKQDELLEFAKSENDEVFMMYFTKLTVQRNNQRALSVGVAEMTSEVVADMYAIRMGCSKGIVAAIGSLVDRGVIVPLLNNFVASVSAAFTFLMLGTYISILGTGALLSGTSFVVIGSVTFTLSFVLSYFSRGYSDVYNADHRRMEDAVRQLIAKLKDNKNIPTTERTALVEEITKLLEASKKLRPWYEGTVIHRAFGWVFSGSDFKLKEIEHYTQALNNNEMTVLSEQLKGI